VAVGRFWWHDAPVAWSAPDRRSVAGRSLDERFRYRTRGQPERDLRWVYVHMVEEYARHNGHADIIRELRPLDRRRPP